jgi:hypothetical protein
MIRGTPFVGFPLHSGQELNVALGHASRHGDFHRLTPPGRSESDASGACAAAACADAMQVAARAAVRAGIRLRTGMVEASGRAAPARRCESQPYTAGSRSWGPRRVHLQQVADGGRPHVVDTAESGSRLHHGHGDREVPAVIRAIMNVR